MTRSQCEANSAAWEATCAGPKWQDDANCPVPRCVPPPEPRCEDEQCVPGRRAMCDQDDDCQRCAYERPVTSADDCYCILCGTPLDRETCAANQASYQQFCVPWPKRDPCPVADCVFPGEPTCNDGTCGDHPDGCFFAEDCALCAYSNVPKSAEECACPMCPQPHSRNFCDAVEAANRTVCSEFDFGACLPPPCPFPGEATCSQDRRCSASPGLEPR